MFDAVARDFVGERADRSQAQRGRLRGDPILTKRLFTLLDLGVDREADLASYLLFDGPFCRQLIEMGRADAHARRDDLMRFFGDAGEDGRADEGPEESWDRNSGSFPTGSGL